MRTIIEKQNKEDNDVLDYQEREKNKKKQTTNNDHPTTIHHHTPNHVKENIVAHAERNWTTRFGHTPLE